MKKKKYTLAFFVFIFCLCLGGCGAVINNNIDVEATENKLKKFDPYNTDKGIYEYVDPETGVHYLVLSNYHGSYAASMTPRFNSDGSVMVTDIK